MVTNWPRVEKEPDFCEIKLERQDNMNKINCGELESQTGHHFDEKRNENPLKDFESDVII